MSRLVKTMLTSLAVLLIIAIAVIVILININKDNLQADTEPTIDEIIEYSYQSPEITTDLKDGSFVRIQFQVVTDSKEAKEEISKREFQLKNILIKELATMEKENFKSGLGNLEEEVKVSLNELMTEGNVTDVYTINKILQ